MNTTRAQRSMPATIPSGPAPGSTTTQMVADITQEVVDNGTVQAFIYTLYDVANNLGSWNPLPFVYPLLIEEKDDSGNVVNSFIVAENTRFEYNVGKVTFIIQDLDGINPLDIANEMSIKVCVTI